MELHPSHIFLSMLLAFVQGVFSPKLQKVRNESLDVQCADLLVERNKKSLAPPIPLPLQNVFKSVVARSFQELDALKERIVQKYPPENHDYFFLDVDTAVLGTMFRVDPRLSNQSYYLTLSMIGYGEDISAEESKVVFLNLLRHLQYKHTHRLPVFVTYYGEGTQLEDFDYMIRQLENGFMRRSELAILGARVPKTIFDRPAKLELTYTVFRISKFLESLLFNEYFTVFMPDHYRNFGLWKEYFSREQKSEGKEVFQTHEQLAEILRNKIELRSRSSN